MNMQVELDDHMGSDLKVVNAARVSMHKRSAWEADGQLSKADQGLIRFLARGMASGDWDNLLDQLVDTKDRDEAKALVRKLNLDKHWTPFAHCMATFYIKAPIFVRSQLVRHTVGVVINEVSRRYVDDEPEFYIPEVWRARAANVKQGSSDNSVEMITTEEGLEFELEELYEESMSALGNIYKLLLDNQVAPEMARMVLPQSMMTEWYWTGSLAAFARICKQRLDSHAQYETRVIAQAISAHMERLFPVSWDSLIKS